ncbi:hypothetical protein F7725_019532, partial [Dissostichus mawsoni]
VVPSNWALWTVGSSRLEGHALNFGDGAVGACALGCFTGCGVEEIRVIQGGNLYQWALFSPLPSLAHSPSSSACCSYLPVVQRLGNPPAREQTHLGMDALKSAGRAIIKSPGVPRHTWGTSKHEKLPENWTDTKETLQDGMVFNVKYLGMTLVGQPKGEDMASAAIRRIVTTARASAKKISYCTADKTQDKVFAYVSQSQFNETLECHAFLCQKKKIAQAVTLTVAQAFKTKARRPGLAVLVQPAKGRRRQQALSVFLLQHKPLVMEEKLRRPFFSASLSSPSPRSNPTRRRPIKHDSWDVDDGLDDPFSRLAESCSQPVSDHADLSPWEVYDHNLLTICNNEFE